MQYVDFARWQREWLAAGALGEQLAWWREQLAGIPPPIELATDRPRRAERTGRGGVGMMPLDGELPAGLLAFFPRAGTTPFLTLPAGFPALLSRDADCDE